MLNFRETFGSGEAAASPSPSREERVPSWDTELFILRAADRPALLRRVQSLQEFLRYHSDANLKDLAYTLNTAPAEDEKCLAMIASSTADLHARLTKAAERLADSSRTQIKDTAGIYYFDRPLYDEGSLALLFPGEGAQYLNMLADLSPHFSEIKETIDDAERLMQNASPPAARAFRDVFRLSPDASEEHRAQAEKDLRRPDAALISVIVANGAMFQLLSQLGLKPAAVAGHSMGELSALVAAGCIERRQSVFDAIGKAVLSHEAMGEMASALLLAVGAGKDVVEQVIRDTVGAGVYLAMDNCPHQSVVVGPPSLMVTIEAALKDRRYICERLPFDSPYHTPLLEPYIGPMRELFENIEFRAAHTTVYSCSTGLPFSSKPDEIRDQAVRHYVMPVEFTRLIRNMHADGVRLFVECGPRGNLTSFAEDILRGERFAAIASDLPHRSGIMQLNHLAAQLAAHRVPLNLESFYSRRDPQRLKWEDAGKWDDAGDVSSLAAEITSRTGSTHEETPPAASDMNGFGEDSAQAMTEIVLSDAATSAAATSLVGEDPSSIVVAPSDRSEVVMQYFSVMEQFLDDQAEMIGAYLGRIRRDDDRGPEIEDTVETLPAIEHLPILRTATIVRFEPAREIVIRRKLDLAEDLYASHHTVGGQAISKVDPHQHGLPVMPMTFILEAMAELASALVPNQPVVGLKTIRLFRWLAFDEAEPASVELSARLLTETMPEASDPLQVQVEIRELGSPGKDADSPGPAAQGIVLLAAHYPEPPAAGEFALTNERPTSIPVDILYKNLFHGPLFQGALPGGRSGDGGIEGDVVVLPRHELLRSEPDPHFLMDPILLDVSIHIISRWHLEFPDQSGRIILPVKLEKLELFGPQPDVGSRFSCRGLTLASTFRNFVHDIDLIDSRGKLWSRMRRLTLWRFYVPFTNKVNFWGQKDEYFISKEWRFAHRQLPVPASCVRLDIPEDQKQAGMRSVTAKVTLAPSEFAQFRAMAGDEGLKTQWLFDRLAAKDAVRVLWHACHGERLFSADVIIEMNEDGTASARPRGSASPKALATVSVARSDDTVMALAAFGPYAGIAIERLGSGLDRADAIGHDGERLLLNQLGVDPTEWAARIRCAKQAISKALNFGHDRLSAMEACDADPSSGDVKIMLHAPLSEHFPEWKSAALISYTVCDGDLVLATSICERAAS